MVGVYCEADPSSLPVTLLVACGTCGADMDFDGLIFSEECDDNDPTNTTTNAGDFDCDGLPTATDCDDMDASNTNSNVNDADCDGVPTSQDCDDNDPTNTNTRGGMDATGVLYNQLKTPTETATKKMILID